MTEVIIIVFLNRFLKLNLQTEALTANKMEVDSTDEITKMETDDADIPEPEIAKLWSQLFRVMDDVHEGTRLAAEGTAKTLSKVRNAPRLCHLKCL